MPIVRGNAVIGVLYLENNEYPRAFTPGRQRALQLLSGQIAVSINNAVLADDLRQALTRERAISAAQTRFIPDQFLQAIGASDIRQVRTGAAAEREVTLLFSDLRGSTGLEETMTPTETGLFINWYLTSLERELASCGGFVESFQGDGILAVFDGAPDSALDAALAMQRAHADMNKALRQTSTEIKTGIGINTGPVLMGAFGSPRRVKCGVLGDAVNLASRIEGQTKVYGSPILVSHHTVEALRQPSRFDLEKVDVIRVSGRLKEVVLYSVNGYA
jgi:class 3 adenylate cyclase